MTAVIWFIIGALVGGFIGVFAMALVIANSRQEISCDPEAQEG